VNCSSSFHSAALFSHTEHLRTTANLSGLPSVVDAGKPIIDNITDAIYGSRKTICVITRRYLQSEWCSREIQMASFRLFDERKDVLILLFLEEIPARQLSPYYRMRRLVKRRTYLSWPQAGQHTGVFWQSVRRALETGDAPTETTNPLTGPAGC
ncbi:toll-like receptor 13, partial [Siniperca chuatsi]|uniref:toll-like receptor 13 n=1 Tax=Siniperca chuatsi TaxID=119488 RepID=UPI001CE09716